MLFNSYVFILAFLPVTVGVYHLLAATGPRRAALLWLVLASLFFYGWWSTAFLALILASMAGNFAFGLAVARTGSGPGGGGGRRIVLICGLAYNLGLLGYFKYANFLVDNLNRAAGTSYHLEAIVLPLAISFFTFQQIAYLVDVYKWGRPETDAVNYALFVTFFPQLIAGPIVHHGEMLPQFRDSRVQRFNAEVFALGITVFVLGLAKKVVIADNAALWATPVFEAAQRGAAVGFFDAWRGALAYTVQLYNDFSGYSDMAIGLGLLFGIRLPVNFDSPYQAASIIDFWRRWHMTLSRFLRDYLYIPLGGNRHGPVRRYANLMVTMLLGGLWHGAGWTFVAWGGLHGLYLLVNHAWRGLWGGRGGAPSAAGPWARRASVALTFLAVVVAWVFFRAESFEAAWRILEGMAGLNGRGHFGKGAYALLLIFALWLIFRAPNPLRWALGYSGESSLAAPEGATPAASRRFVPTARWGLIMAALAVICLLSLNGIAWRESEFLYYQF